MLFSGWRATVNERFCALELDRIQHMDAEARNAAKSGTSAASVASLTAATDSGKSTNSSSSSVDKSASSSGISSLRSLEDKTCSSSNSICSSGTSPPNCVSHKNSSTTVHTSKSNNNISGGLPGLCYDHFSAHDLAPHKIEAEVMYEQYLSEKVRNIPCCYYGTFLHQHFIIFYPYIVTLIFLLATVKTSICVKFLSAKSWLSYCQEECIYSEMATR